MTNDAYKPEALIHDHRNFSRASLKGRLSKHNFADGNLPRVEMFLWDLELFLHFQEIFKEKVVLKGGAAVQLYLPVNLQRTSTDIDMICAVSTDELDKAIAAIEKKFEGRDGLLKFHRHIPKNPRTNLPFLRTFFIDAPSICTNRELNTGREGPQRQRLKVEFFLTEEPVKVNPVQPQEVFALEMGGQTYHVLPINPLLGDKLATLAPTTVGIPLSRPKEYFKQVYDVDTLLRSQRLQIDIGEVETHFLSNAQNESDLRGISVNTEKIIEDIRAQMQRLTSVDIGDNGALIKPINDFQSLYLRETARQDKSDWAITGARISFFIDCIRGLRNNKLLELLDKTDLLLTKGFVQGKKKTSYQTQFKSEFLEKFNQHNKHLNRILQGKHPRRVFWAVVSPSTLEESASWAKTLIRFQNLMDAIESCNPSGVALMLNTIKSNNELESFMADKGKELITKAEGMEAREQDEDRKQSYATIITYLHAAINGGEIGIGINKEKNDRHQSEQSTPAPWDTFK